MDPNWKSATANAKPEKAKAHNRLGYNRLQNVTKKLQYYNGENIDKANEIVRLSTTEYENGEINYVEYVNALNEAIDMRMKQADVINEYNEAVLALMALNNSL